MIRTTLPPRAFIPNPDTKIAQPSNSEAAYNVLITGATGNLGLACIKYAQEHGWQVTPMARSLGMDLSNWADVDAWFEMDRTTYDLVIVAHGTHRIKSIYNTGEEDFMYVVQNNLCSAAALTTGLLRHQRLRRNGLIVYCSSIQATHTRAGRSAYAAAKAGIEGYMRGVAVELSGYAGALCLRMGQFQQTMHGVDLTREEIERLQARCHTPWTKPEDVARFIWQLYEQPSMTGCVVDIDSGQGLSIW